MARRRSAAAAGRAASTGFDERFHAFDPEENADGLGQVRYVLELEVYGLASPEPWWNMSISSLFEGACSESSENSVVIMTLHRCAMLISLLIFNHKVLHKEHWQY